MSVLSDMELQSAVDSLERYTLDLERRLSRLEGESVDQPEPSAFEAALDEAWDWANRRDASSYTINRLIWAIHDAMNAIPHQPRYRWAGVASIALAWSESLEPAARERVLADRENDPYGGEVQDLLLSELLNWMSRLATRLDGKEQCLDRIARTALHLAVEAEQ